MIKFRRILAAPLLLATFTAFAVVGLACSTDETSETSSGSSGGVERVADDARIYSLNDVMAAGAKAPKEYDVTELPGAVSAWRVIFQQKDFEVRLYPDHGIAVGQGTEWADAATGEDAVVVGNDVRWQEGARDRRQCNRAASTPHSGCNYTARYGDYIILGNMILMCEGANSEEALKSCRYFIDQMGSSSS